MGWYSFLNIPLYIFPFQKNTNLFMTRVWSRNERVTMCSWYNAPPPSLVVQWSRAAIFNSFKSSCMSLCVCTYIYIHIQLCEDSVDSTWRFHGHSLSLVRALERGGWMRGWGWRVVFYYKFLALTAAARGSLLTLSREHINLARKVFEQTTFRRNGRINGRSAKTGRGGGGGSDFQILRIPFGGGGGETKFTSFVWVYKVTGPFEFLDKLSFPSITVQLW